MAEEIIHLSDVCDVKVLRSYPQGDVEVLACPAGSKAGSPFGVILHVTHEEGEWFCHFMAGSSDVFGIFPLSPRCFVLIAHGEAYYVPVYESGRCSELACGVVTQAETIPAIPLLVLASPFEVFGIGPEGLKWRTPRLATDGIKILSVSPDSITGVATDVSDIYIEFTIDPKTGKHEGGCPMPFPPGDQVDHS